MTASINSIGTMIPANISTQLDQIASERIQQYAATTGLSTDTVQLSRNKTVILEADLLKQTQPDLYKKLKKQVTKGKRNLDKEKTATAIMRALEKNPETKELAKNIKTTCEPHSIPTAKTIKAEQAHQREIIKAEQLATERKTSKKANESWQNKKKLQKSPEGIATKRLDQNVMNANQDINRAVREALEQNPQNKQTIEEVEKKVKETIKDMRTKARPTQESVQQFKQTVKEEIKNAQQQIATASGTTANNTKPVAKTAAKESKGLWNWLTKTTAGKWTAAGVGLVAIGAALWAGLSGDKKAEDANKLNEAA